MPTETTRPQGHYSPQDGRPKLPKKEKAPNNPLVRGIVEFCKALQARRDDTADSGTNGSTLISAANDGEQDGGPSSALATLQVATTDMPKRYTLYPPLLLLPPNFAMQNPRWTAFYHALGERDRMELFRYVAEEGFKGMGVSRVAINAPIAAEVDNGGRGADGVDDMDRSVDTTVQTTTTPKEQNVLRCPSGLVPVYGDWGPVPDDPHHRGRLILHPTAKDFDEAFWISTSQHQGIVQCWAPLYTMFSRGNISEKARILGLQSHFPGLGQPELLHHQQIGELDVVDFYVGIGYFASCYLSRGARRVYGWDINPWSIEGLRRGCEKNGWRCLVVRVGETGCLQGQLSIRDLVEEIERGDHAGEQEAVVRCVAFLGDNKWAWKVLEEMQREYGRIEMDEGRIRLRLNVRHANLGLLPSSRASWQGAVKVVAGLSDGGTGGWLHVHENVDARQIDVMGGEIVRELDGLTRREARYPYAASCAHVEQVKTYAPGVMHCVFDIEIKPNG
ncbi:uncharacterized protein Z520_01881 [Fonsecaea multimorphosa CBS 102226]|uniref:tRNA wybutosine-synthesizing protein 2 n=1 Tax=Fonsecaea multimorphosa CBS 102226 TaxID=1442371 RepID=A0A0D2K725_9EURO|nr:uncharacterized protein Z520_01881 [Fonsecaea multimorphosa CBS 102226]KIY01743.1 hypothetical protein Z520_01881 [Fonsecaea multimorphosa CBS 102226]OAL29937.1 hypothetical protein AYO22_01843 [Fonsecaea multimorphosa]